MRVRVRQRQRLVVARHLVGPSWQETTSTSSVRGPQCSSRTSVGGPLELLPALQPGGAVERRILGDEHGVEERALFDAAPRVGLVHR